MKKKPLFEDDEFVLNEAGLFVFTAEYLLKRGYCCGNGCLNCPFDYKNVVNLERKKQLIDNMEQRQQNRLNKPLDNANID